MIARELVPYLYTITGGLYLNLIFFLGWIGLHIIRVGNVQHLITAFRIPRNQALFAGGWALVLICNHILQHGPATGIHVFALVYLFGFLIMAKVYARDRFPVFKWLLYYVIFVLGVQAAYSIPGLILYPKAARMIMHAVTPSSVMHLRVLGIGSYGDYLGLAIGLPLFWTIAATRRGKTASLICFASCGAIFTAILLSTFTAAATIALLGSVGAVIVILSNTRAAKERKDMSRIFFLVVSVVICIFIFQNMIAETDQFQYIFHKFQKSLTGDIDSMGNQRGWRAIMSLNTWFDHPIFGVGGYHGVHFYQSLVGGHSSWFDTAAEYGLAGLIPILCLTLSIALRPIRQISVKTSADMRLIFKGCFITGACFFIAGIIDPVLGATNVIFIIFFLTVGSTENIWSLATNFRRHGS